MSAADLHLTFHGIVRTIAEVLDCEDGWPTSHAARVAHLGRLIEAERGGDEARVYYGGLLHDLGGSGLDEHITSYAEREFADTSSQSHPRVGGLLLRSCFLLEPLQPMVELHHERFDGGGFPAGLHGAAIPNGALVVHAADAIEQALRMAAPGDRAAAARTTIATLADGAVSGAIAQAATNVFARRPELVDELFDPGRMAQIHAQPVHGYPGLDTSSRVELVTPLLLLLARLVDSRSYRRLGHSHRVAYYALHIARALGEDVIEPWDAAWAGLLHDVGSIALTRRVLQRTGQWPSEGEIALRVRSRAQAVIEQVSGLEYLAHAVIAHRDRYDGVDNPNALAGERIPLVARILAYADRYDRLTRFGQAHPHGDAVAELRRACGTVLDPHLADAVFATLDRVAPLAPAVPAEVCDWQAYFEVGPQEPAVRARRRSEPPRVVGRGVLLVDLESWQEVTIDGDLAIVAGHEVLTQLCGSEDGDHLRDFLSVDSLVDLATHIGARAPVATLYVFTPTNRPIETIVQPAGATWRLLLRSAANRLQSLDRLALFYRNFLSSSEAVVFTDPNGRIIDVNRAFLDLFGYSLREVIGQHTRMLKSGRQPDAFYQQMWTAITDPAVGSWSGDLVDRRRDGRELHVHMRVSAVRDASGSCIGYIAHHHDITERKHAEAELLRRDEELRRTNLELRRLSQFKTDMVAITSHDLKSPLASIVGVANLLARSLGRMPEERVVSHLERIADTARHLTSFINDLLDLEKIESGALTLDLIPLRIDRLLQQVVDDTSAALVRDVRFELDLPPPVRAIAGDVVRLEQVVGNLLANAGKFAPDGSTVRVAMREDAEQVRITIEDEGPGVSRADLDAIFERYFQSDRKAALPKRGAGAGLGLSIVRSLVQLHGGRVWAENQDRGGCRFVVELPARRPERITGAPMTLVVASVTTDSLELVDLLSAAGHVVRRLDSLSELRRIWRVTEPRVVVVSRPFVDPAAVSQLQAERADGDRAAMLVLLDDEQPEPCERHPFDAVVTPPVLHEEVYALLRAADSSRAEAS